MRRAYAPECSDDRDPGSWLERHEYPYLGRAGQTTLVDIVLRRVVGRGVYELRNSAGAKPKGEDSRKQRPGSPIA